MKNEADFKREVVKQFKKLGHYARRIEDKFTVGFPDLVTIPRGYPVFFVEAKIVRGHSFGPTERQYVELARLDISPKHSAPCLMGFDGHEIYLHPYAQSAKVHECLVKHDNETLVEFFQRFYHEKMEI